tara:strand:- start:18099 stop:18767 length:669 start_codon:yes stop_codon:yes gene_type:complete
VSRNTWIIFIVICIAILGGLIFLSRQDRADVGEVNTNAIVAASEANGNIGDHVYGSTEGNVLLIEYGDFQCPACKSAFPILQEIKEEYKDKLTFIFRNNPITQIHPNARAAAAAAEAAGLQGKYWEMHDALYEQQDDWSNASVDERLSFFVAMAKEVGIDDIDQFKRDIESDAVSSKINFDLSLGRKDNVSGTPTIFLNQEQLESDVWANKEALKAKVEEAL